MQKVSLGNDNVLTTDTWVHLVASVPELAKLARNTPIEPTKAQIELFRFACSEAMNRVKTRAKIQAPSREQAENVIRALHKVHKPSSNR